jgi:hypothetical protein
MQLCPLLERELAARVGGRYHGLVVPCGLTPGKHGKGLVSRLPGIGHHFGDVGYRSSLQQVMSDLEHMGREGIGIEMFQCQANLVVEPLASRHTEFAVEYVPD